MKLEDEKKLVATSLMGWEVDEYNGIGISADYGVGFNFHRWNPQSERKWWDEIWEKMDGRTLGKYIDTILDIVEQKHIKGCPSGAYYYVELHTAKPELCWKVLLKTLKEAE